MSLGLMKSMLPAGTVYREQTIILSPFEDDGSSRVVARRAFIGAEAVGAFGAMETDALILQSVQRLIRQAVNMVVHIRRTAEGRTVEAILTLNRTGP